MLIPVPRPDPFADRHIGPDLQDVQLMLDVVGHPDLESLSQAAIPATIAWREGLDLPATLTEEQATDALRRMAAANTVGV
ncbi:MAG: hypothetical protein OEV20_08175, partial [Actinomycetota bacterium]|nr:hypothetical protein [Actinomycetota bacterium]